MNASIEQLLARPELKPSGKLIADDVEAVQRIFGNTLPAELLRLWEAGPSFEIESINVTILGPHEVLDLVQKSDWPFVSFGFLPVLYDHESNYIVLCTHAPLAFRLAFMPHDDSTRLLYRNFDGFATDLLQLVETTKGWASSYYYGAVGDYGATSPRDERDQRSALDLMTTDGNNYEWNFAIQLLDSGSLEEWEKLLNTDHFVRRDALSRLQQLPDNRIQALLARDHIELEAFRGRVMEAIRQGNLDVESSSKGGVRINGKWFMPDFFFHRRHVPDAMRRIVDWIDDICAGRNPRERPGNIMQDGD